MNRVKFNGKFYYKTYINGLPAYLGEGYQMATEFCMTRLRANVYNDGVYYEINTSFDIFAKNTNDYITLAYKKPSRIAHFPYELFSDEFVEKLSAALHDYAKNKAKSSNCDKDKLNQEIFQIKQVIESKREEKLVAENVKPE